MSQPTPRIAVGPKSSTVTCPSCHAQVQTTVNKTVENRAHIWAFLLCICGCWPCCLIPYCVDSCHSSVHYCPNCNAYLGTYETN